MSNELLIAIIAGLGGMLGWGLADLFAKKTIDAIGDIQSLALAHVFGTAGMFFVLLYRVYFSSSGVSMPKSASVLGALIFFGLLQGGIYLLVYKGFGKGKVSILNPVFASFSGITALISIVIFKEAVTSAILIGLCVIFIGILLINIDITALQSKKLNFAKVAGFKEIAVATILAAFWTIGWDKFVGGSDWVVYSFLMYAIMTSAILLYANTKGIRLTVSKKWVWKYLIFIGVSETIAYLAVSLGYSITTKTSIIALLSGAFSLPTIMFARIFLKEKVAGVQTIGALTIVLGVLLLSVL